MKSKSLEFDLLPDGVCQLDAQALHALAHGVELGLPLGAQFLVLEDDADDLGAMVGRLRDGAADDVLHLARHDVGGGRIPGDGDGNAGALAIEAEILARREGDHAFRAPRTAILRTP